MLIELDYETVSALESALIVAEVIRAQDAQDWAKMAGSQGAAERRQTAEELAALGQGGLCLNCEVCTFPNCGFGK